MSEDQDYDLFLEIARADHASREMPSANARKIEAGVQSHVSWRRRLPAAINASLSTMSEQSTAARAERGDGIRRPTFTSSSWAKGIAVLLPVLAASVASYSVVAIRVPQGAPRPLTSASITEPSAAMPVVPPPKEVGEALAGPGELPDVKEPLAAPIERPPAPRASRTSHAAADTFEAELALLTQVTAALQAKNGGRALSLIDEHDRRFPNGVLAPEFVGERVLTLAALGRRAEACAKATTFLAEYPKSPLVPQVRASCVESISNP